MLMALVIILCAVLFLLAVVFPLTSRGPQRGASRSLGAGARAGRRLPGPLGRLASRSMGSSRRAADASGGAGRRLRGRLPF
jgi:hypothetical protein